MRVTIRVETSGGPAAGIKPRAWGNMKKAALIEGVKEWHERYAALRFTKAGGSKYGFQERKTKGGNKKRWRKSISSEPLVWSGQTRTAVMGANKYGTENQNTAYISLPIGYMKQYRPKGYKAGQLLREVTAVTDDESDELALFVERSLAAKLNGS